MNGVSLLRSKVVGLGMICVLIGLRSHWQSDVVAIFPASTPSQMASSDAWIVPVVRWFGVGEWSIWWFPLFSLAAAGIVTHVCRGVNGSLGPERMLAAIGLMLLVEPRDLIPGALLALLPDPNPDVREHNDPWRILLVAGLAVCVTLEFGVVWFCAVMLLAMRQWIAGSRIGTSWIGLLLLSVGTIMAAGWLPGWGAAAARPISWAWLRPTWELMPSLASVVHSSRHLTALALMGPFFVLAILSNGWSGRDRLRLTLLAVCSMLAVGCQRYTFMAALAGMSWFRDVPGMRLSPRMTTLTWTAGVLMAVGRLAWVTDWPTVVSGTSVAQRLDPTAWDSAGPVILMNLDHSSDWQEAGLARRFPLLADDRWDGLGPAYAEYAALCRDLRQVRDHGYLRSDQEWGGYKRWIAQWAPALVVVDSQDVEAIRGLSLSPDWRLMGLDGVRAIFGRSDVPGNRRQMQQALRCLMTLEWPAQLSDFSLENTIVSGGVREDRAVAEMLCALRFPYAALRFVRQDRSRQSQRLRASCYLELAHRVSTHASAGSLLDQYRAVILARSALDRGLGTEADRLRMSRGLAGLLDRSQPQSPQGTAEETVRAALLRGDRGEVDRRLQEIQEPLQSYYRVLAESPERSAAELCAALQAAISRLDESTHPETRSEAAFYLGCAAIEAGEPLLAISALEESARHAPQQAFREMRQMYLRQLLR